MANIMVRKQSHALAQYEAYRQMMTAQYPLSKSPIIPTRFQDSQAVRQNLQKAVGDTATHGIKFRQDLAPEIYPLFIKTFPLYDLIRKLECTGIAYSWIVHTDFTLDRLLPRTIRESGVVPEDLSPYERFFTNIAVFATKRGATLKAQFASRGAGGGDPAAAELDDGLTTIANDVQNCMMFRQTHDKTGDVDSDVGQYDVDGFDGLRYYFTLPQFAGNKVTPETGVTFPIGQAIDDAALAIQDRGGTPNAIIGGPGLRAALRNEMQNNDKVMVVRYYSDETVDVLPGVRVSQVSTSAGLLPIIIVPQLRKNECYVLDLDALAMPWLGSPTPTVLELPLGGDSTLRQLYIPFLMVGLAVTMPYYIYQVMLPTLARVTAALPAAKNGGNK